MLVDRAPNGWKIAFDRAEMRRWSRLIVSFRRFVKKPVPRTTDAQLWDQFVREFLIRGGTRLLDRIDKDPKKKTKLLRDTSLRALTNVPSRLRYRRLRDAVENAARFPRRSAKSITKCLTTNKNVVRDGHFVLLKNLPNSTSDVELRRNVLERCPELGRKGASDFLIAVGKAQDLAAIDTRILRCLERHFDAGRDIRRAQSSLALYLALESALRKVAESNKIPLSQLDRIIFQASGKSMLDFFLERKVEAAI